MKKQIYWPSRQKHHHLMHCAVKISMHARSVQYIRARSMHYMQGSCKPKSLHTFSKRKHNQPWNSLQRSVSNHLDLISQTSVFVCECWMAFQGHFNKWKRCQHQRSFMSNFHWSFHNRKGSHPFVFQSHCQRENTGD